MRTWEDLVRVLASPVVQSRRSPKTHLRDAPADLKLDRVRAQTTRVRNMALLRRLAVNAPRNVRVLSSSPPSRDDLDLNFNSPKDAFKSKKTSELVRAYFVYQICSVNWLVENNDMCRAKGSVLPNRERNEWVEWIFDRCKRACVPGRPTPAVRRPAAPEAGSPTVVHVACLVARHKNVMLPKCG
ncbi:hypothetical protein SFRURICE_021064 [Spodoptera frugiperda]|nr:hypothetical protein SFRURICE_021064 [Spodoptera frugiperda]